MQVTYAENIVKEYSGYDVAYWRSKAKNMRVLGRAMAMRRGRAMARLCECGMSKQDIADMFGVSRCAVRKSINRQYGVDVPKGTLVDPALLAASRERWERARAALASEDDAYFARRREVGQWA